jgi:ADP-ribose pyrophosphatase
VERDAIRPRIGERQPVYQDRNHRIYRVTLDFGTATKELYVGDQGRCAGLVVEGEKGILLSRQYRYLIDRLSWEIPGGRIEEGESAEAAAIRECQEETGVPCRSVRPLLSFQPGLDALHNPTYLFHSCEFDLVAEHNPSPTESLEVVCIQLQECLDMVFDGRIVDSLSLIALMSYSLRQRGS